MGHIPNANLVLSSLDLDWYSDFISRRARQIRQSTLDMVHTLDFRSFGKDAYDFDIDHTHSLLGVGPNRRSISGSFRVLPILFPNLRCILLDGHAELNLNQLALVSVDDGTYPGDKTLGQLSLLSFKDTQCPLPANFFDTPRFHFLVYLDVSNLPGSLVHLIASVKSARGLPHLSVFKARRRELDDSTAMLLFKAFQGSLWSLDLSQNKLTDTVLETLRRQCTDCHSLRSLSTFPIEGSMTSCSKYIGSDEYGHFEFLNESEWSKSFSHPHRYHVDAPTYEHDSSDHSPPRAARSDATAPIQMDTLDHIVDALAGDDENLAPAGYQLQNLGITRAPRGITHLHLSQNKLTQWGLHKMLRRFPGQLEHLDCGSVVFVSLANWAGNRTWPKSTKLHGVFGFAHIFRPIISCNLRSLRIHHSLVTGIPTLEVEGVSNPTYAHTAETVIRPYIDAAFAELFVPDMNPRLTSLTLTGIPRRSTGPLIQRLVNFVKLASDQEQAIIELSASKFMAPGRLQGLRHLCLEFEADECFNVLSPFDFGSNTFNSPGLFDGQVNSVTNSGGNSNKPMFSFFKSSEISPRLTSSPSPLLATTPSHRQLKKKIGSISGSLDYSSAQPTVSTPSSPPTQSTSTRLQQYPYTEAAHNLISFPSSWMGDLIKLSVWVGTGIITQPADLPPPYQPQQPYALPSSPSSSSSSASASALTTISANTTTIPTMNISPAMIRNRYMTLVCDPYFRTHIGPTTPSHLIAGIPDTSLVFYSAWDATVIPHTAMPTFVSPRELRDVQQDVVASLKKYRLATRSATAESKSPKAAAAMATSAFSSSSIELPDADEWTRLGESHVFWTGRLELRL